VPSGSSEGHDFKTTDLRRSTLRLSLLLQLKVTKGERVPYQEGQEERVEMRQTLRIHQEECVPHQ